MSADDKGSLYDALARIDRELVQLLGDELARIDRELVQLLGDRCDEFEITCTTCRAWRTRDDLRALFESLAD